MNPPEAPSAAALPGDGAVPLESILCTEELHRRPSRPPDYEAENRALTALAKVMADSPRTLLQTLADTILEVLRADSAGLSLLRTHDGGQQFYWPAIAGAWKPHIGGGTPRDFGPCGDVLDCNAPLLFKHFERRYPYLLAATPVAEEALLIPFFVHGQAVGTIWAMAHDERRRFDAEDLRQLESLGRFASAAYQAVHFSEAEDSRRAALNLMEDAVHARQAVETLNAALRESEQRYRNLFDSMDEGYCIIEMIFDEHEEPVDYRFLEVNPAFEKQSGMHDAVGKRMLEFVPDIEEHWLANYGNVALTGEPIRFANEYRALGGRWFDVYAFRIGGVDSRKVAVLFTDIKERKENERALRESEERFRTLADNMSQLAWTADAQGRIYWYNQRWYDYTGSTLEETRGLGWKAVQHPDHAERVAQSIQRAVDTGEPWEDTFPLRAADGAYRWFLSRSRPIRDEAGNVVRWFGTNTDVTEQREMENQIKQQAAQLADESRRKDEFLAMLSHELRNPLAPIRSAVHLLRMQERSGSENRLQQQAHEIIERQVANLTKLVSDLLEVSRVVSGRIRLNRQTVDLNQIAQHATETVKPLIEQCKHELVLKLCDEPIWVNADATRMEEVFINLLNNAAKYTQKGGRIEVHCEHAPAAGNYAQVRVRDNGMGIDKELLPCIFDLFTQAERTLARSGGGLGIGLSLAQRLVDLHGGTLQAYSPPQDRPGERGSEFIVTLPLAQAPEVPQPIEPGTQGAPRRDGIRVLIVDDNIDQVTMLAGALRHAGYSVQSAYAGPEGLQIALQWRPDIVLLDIGLPGLDGYEVARRLRSDPSTKAARLIALTGYVRDTDITRSREAGFDAHLSKPLEFGELEKLMAAPRSQEQT